MNARSALATLLLWIALWSALLTASVAITTLALHNQTRSAPRVPAPHVVNVSVPHGLPAPTTMLNELRKSAP